jgi:hypothetical protein
MLPTAAPRAVRAGGVKPRRSEGTRPNLTPCWGTRRLTEWPGVLTRRRSNRRTNGGGLRGADTRAGRYLANLETVSSFQMTIQIARAPHLKTRRFRRARSKTIALPSNCCASFPLRSTAPPVEAAAEEEGEEALVSQSPSSTPR